MLILKVGLIYAPEAKKDSLKIKHIEKKIA
jgi:hypothetical protein